MRVAGLIVCLLLAVCLSVPASANDAADAEPGAATVALIGELTFNVLHEEFRTAGGRDPVYPAGMPTPVRVELPATGTFAERLEAMRGGPLANMEPGVVYAIAGTRLLAVAPPGTRGNVIERPPFAAAHDDRLHGTGVVAAAIGRTTGTNPDALAVFVAGGYNDAKAWAWVRDQQWVDVASVSGYAVSPVQCEAAPEVRAIVAKGRTVFVSSGNLSDQYEQLTSPNGLAEVYQVGGVDRSGKTWLGPHLDESTDTYKFMGHVTRPYDTGGLYSFRTAAHDSLAGDMQFGGTSGATPRTAGHALHLITEARSILGARGIGGAYASLASGATPPGAGPLADGDFTRAELEALLRATAMPAEAASPGRYLLEGYGAVTDATIATAKRVLAGEASVAPRIDEDRAHAATEAARGALHGPPRCS